MSIDEQVRQWQEAYNAERQARERAERDRFDLGQRIRTLERERDHLKLQAEVQAQEARTANATIHEIYQVITGGKGEPGNWNGANPVRERISTLEAALRSIHKISSDTLAGNTDGPVDHAWRIEQLRDIWIRAKNALATRPQAVDAQPDEADKQPPEQRSNPRQRDLRIGDRVRTPSGKYDRVASFHDDNGTFLENSGWYCATELTLVEETMDYDMSIHSNPDHQAWAGFFMETFPNCGIDRDTMAGWFANAMMAKVDSMAQEGEQGSADEALPFALKDDGPLMVAANAYYEESGSSAAFVSLFDLRKQWRALQRPRVPKKVRALPERMEREVHARDDGDFISDYMRGQCDAISHWQEEVERAIRASEGSDDET